jgi:acetate kinase
VVSCHLGAGASLAAVRSGRSLDTTMGFTPLEGLVMATRSGNVDPGMLLWLLERKRVDARAMSQALEYESGLHGLAGTADMREVLAAAARGDADARLGRDVYVHRLRAGIAAMTATLGGLDALVFTGRVGERAPAIRAAAAETFGFLAIAVHAERNNAAQHDADVTASGATARTFVIESREDREIARGVRDVVGGQA